MEDRPILSAAKCRPMILVSRNIRYMRILAGVPREGGVKYNNCLKCYTYVKTLNKNTCLLVINRRGVVVSALSAINEVNQHRARLLLGWVTVCGQVNRLGM